MIGRRRNSPFFMQSELKQPNIPYSRSAAAEKLPERKKLYYVPPAKKLPSKGFLAVKRGFDIVFSLLGMTLLALPMLVITLIVAVDSPGAPIYKQERLGLHGKAFTIYKFRTMHVDAERNGPKWADENDSRCTAVGRFLRDRRLDELPQLINILRGDMSFVGPRPERRCFYDLFEEYIDGFSNRLEAVPGLTGLAQVNGGYDLLPEEKIVFDMEYINKCSLKLDASCLIRTVWAMLKHDGAR